MSRWLPHEPLWCETTAFCPHALCSTMDSVLFGQHTRPRLFRAAPSPIDDCRSSRYRTVRGEQRGTDGRGCRPEHSRAAAAPEHFQSFRSREGEVVAARFRVSMGELELRLEKCLCILLWLFILNVTCPGAGATDSRSSSLPSPTTDARSSSLQSRTADSRSSSFQSGAADARSSSLQSRTADSRSLSLRTDGQTAEFRAARSVHLQY